MSFNTITDLFLPKLDENDKAKEGYYFKYVENFTADEFEHFILEWLKFIKNKDKCIELFKIGSTGDEGVDIFGFNDGKYYLYQCKHYSRALNQNEFIYILIKALFYFFKQFKTNYPERVFAVPLNSINGKSARSFSEKDKFKKLCYESIDSCISVEKLDVSDVDIDAFKMYFLGFDINRYEVLDVKQVMREYINSDLRGFRFSSNLPISIKRIDVNIEKDMNKKRFYTQAFDCLNESTLNDDKKQDYLNNIVRDFYLAKSLQYTCLHFLGNVVEFDIIKNSVFDQLKYYDYSEYDSKFHKMNDILKNIASINTSSSYLDYGLHLVSSRDCQGICHMLVDDGEYNWYE